MCKKTGQLRSKLLNVVFEVENYSLKIDPNEVDYDWLSGKRAEIVDSILDILGMVEQEAEIMKERIKEQKLGIN